jgi:hypothetical protein
MTKTLGVEGCDAKPLKSSQSNWLGLGRPRALWPKSSRVKNCMELWFDKKQKKGKENRDSKWSEQLGKIITSPSKAVVAFQKLAVPEVSWKDPRAASLCQSSGQQHYHFWLHPKSDAIWYQYVLCEDKIDQACWQVWDIRCCLQKQLTDASACQRKTDCQEEVGWKHQQSQNIWKVLIAWYVLEEDRGDTWKGLNTRPQWCWGRSLTVVCWPSERNSRSKWARDCGVTKLAYFAQPLSCKVAVNVGIKTVVSCWFED